MIHANLSLPDQGQRSLAEMNRDELLLAVLSAESAGFTATADALMNLLEMLMTRQHEATH